MTEALFYLPLVLLLLAVLCFWGAHRLRRGMPPGQIVYDDAGDDTSETLVSATYGLAGKPDYLLDEVGGDGLIPVEVKSGKAPPAGKPYRSHVMQLATYFLLVEDVLDSEAPYGFIRYQDEMIRVENTDALRAELLSIVEQMQHIVQSERAHRSHKLARRCENCSVRYACDESLV